MLKALKEIGSKRKLKRAVGDYEVPSFPALAMRALEMARSAGTSANDLAEVISQDPGLSVRILGAVNSSAYALRRKVDNLSQGVALLGMSNVESIVAAVAVGRTYQAVDTPGFDRKRFWQAAAQRAATSQALSKRISPGARSAGFTAALLQDMAVPLLAASRSDYAEIRRAWYAGEGTLVELERNAFGFDHAEIGGWLCEEWGLPESLRIAVAAHHEPPGTVSEVPPAVSMVAPLGESDENKGLDEVYRLVLSKCDMALEELEGLVAAALESADELASVFGG